VWEYLSLGTNDRMKSADKRKRRIRQCRKVSTKSVRALLGELEPGVEVFGLTMGQFSSIDLLSYILEETGPAEVDIATWTSAPSDTEHVRRLFIEQSVITRCRWVINYALPRLQPEYCEALIDKFGIDCIRTIAIHGKFQTIKNDRWNIALRTSMNPNQNKRIQWFELSDDPNMCQFYRSLVDEIWETQPAGLVLDRPARGLAATDRLAFEPDPIGRKRGRKQVFVKL